MNIIEPLPRASNKPLPHASNKPLPHASNKLNRLLIFNLKFGTAESK